jgi:hypothetical protein
MSATPDVEVGSAPTGPQPVTTLWKPPQSDHLWAAFFTVIFKALSLLLYIARGLFTNFIMGFVVIIILIAADFYTVKKISGRLLVGLLWWSEPGANGQSTWHFDSNINFKPGLFDSQLFWWSLILYPAFWAFLSLGHLIPPSEELMITGTGLILSGSNLLGYVRCRKDSRAQFKKLMKAGIAASLSL